MRIIQCKYPFEKLIWVFKRVFLELLKITGVILWFIQYDFTKKMSKQENNYCVFIQNMLQYKEENFLCFFLFPEKAERKDKYVSIGKGYA